MRRIIWILALVVCALAIAGSAPLIDWAALGRHHASLAARVAVHPLTSAGIYLAAYILTAALSLPHAAIMTVAGGLLFGATYGCALTIAGATIGSTLLQVFLRSAFGETLQRQRARVPETIRDRLAADGFRYLLALRLLPVFPFWVVNLAAAAAGLPLRVFWPATLIGIAPASYVLSAIGAGVGSVLAAGGTPDLTVLYAPHILLPLVGLALLVLLSTRLRRRSGAHV